MWFGKFYFFKDESQQGENIAYYLMSNNVSKIYIFRITCVHYNVVEYTMINKMSTIDKTL